MHRPIRLALVLLALLLPAGAARAAGSGADSSAAETAKWDVTRPFGPVTTVRFTVTEGTWMNLDVSPDGREIVFDLLGDIYVMPITGGRARRLRGGPSFDVQPRLSPDGRRIAFTSDAGGGDNIWVMNRDGSDAHPVTKEDFRLLNNPCWTPDGEYIVARKHFTSRRSLGAGEMWIFHVAGGRGLQLTKRRNDQQDAGEPWVSPDGRYVYFSEDMSPGGRFRYNKDPNGQIYVIRRYDRETGEVRDIVTGAGGAVRPQVSPDNRYIAFVRRIRARSVLCLYEIATGIVTPLYDGMSIDQQETWAIFGPYPNFNWTPDSRSIVFWAKGGIHRIDVRTREVTDIPFEAEVEQTIHEALHFRQEAHPARFESRMIRHAVTSPDDRWLVFSALGRLWKKRLPDGRPERVTDDDARFEYWPSFSPDGRWLVYATWNDDEAGAIWRVDLNGRGRRRLTKRPGLYRTPRVSPDGRRIVFLRTPGDAVIGYAYGVDPGIYWMPARGGEMHFVRERGRDPRFSADGRRILFVETIEKGRKALRSVRPDGGDVRTIFTSKYATSFVPSPDNRWVAFTELFNAYIAAFPETGRPIDLSGRTRAVPVRRVTRDAGRDLHWSADGRRLHWVLGPQYFSRDVRRTFPFVEGAEDTVAPPDTAGLDVGLWLDSDVPSGTLALVGARVITMRGDEVIDDATIVVEGNRIVEVGPRDAVTVARGARRIDVSGRTIIPGLVDVHAHMWMGSSGMTPQTPWPYYANLAFGVTTTHDPSNRTEMVFTHAEMVRHGDIVGPRIFSTGTILYGAEGDFKAVINSLDDARSHLRRMKAVGAFSVKSYNQPRRDQRQQIIRAARELGMLVVPEGGSTFYHNLTMILDGHTGIEHTIPVAPIYDDVVGLWKASRTALTPTLIVGYGGLWGENYWYAKTEVWKDRHLLAFTPRPIVDARARRRTIVPDEEYNHVRLARNCKRLVDAGVHVQLGAHGQLQGLGAHWELWMFTQGGMTPMEALRCATLWGAEYIGMGDQLGSIEPGKLADLVVLEADPLVDIHNSRRVVMVMANGRLFDAATMDEIGNRPRRRGRFWFERPESSDAFIWRGDAFGYGIGACGCVPDVPPPGS